MTRFIGSIELVELRGGMSTVVVSEIVGVEWFPSSLMSSDARVIVTLRNGHTIGEYFGQRVGADGQALLRYDELLEEIGWRRAVDS